jgi:hypothetical protein
VESFGLPEKAGFSDHTALFFWLGDVKFPSGVWRDSSRGGRQETPTADTTLVSLRTKAAVFTVA